MPPLSLLFSLDPFLLKLVANEMLFNKNGQRQRLVSRKAKAPQVDSGHLSGRPRAQQTTLLIRGPRESSGGRSRGAHAQPAQRKALADWARHLERLGEEGVRSSQTPRT